MTALAENKGPGRSRRGPFRSAVIVAALPLAILLITLDLRPSVDRPNVQVSVRGADVTRAGGTTVVMGDVRQMCRDECDDLLLRDKALEGGYEIDVLDSRARTLASGGSGYVTSGTFDSWVIEDGAAAPMIKHVDVAVMRSDGY